MILNRLGSKSKIAKKIQQHFPSHKIYSEPFFGAGGMFFHKPKVEYNIVNDNDSDVFNLYQVVLNHKEELKKAFYIMPFHGDLLEYWKKNKETDPIKKAIRFLFISNFTYLGLARGGMRSNPAKPKKYFESNLDLTFNLLKDVQFFNKDFRKFIDLISLNEREIKNTFIYADPPYLDTDNNYENSFSKQDSIDLFNGLEQKKCKFAMSEFNQSFILNQAKKRNLNVIMIGDRKNLTNTRTEILITNYDKPLTLF